MLSRALALLALAHSPGPEVQPFIAVSAPTFVLRQVRVVDGTGALAREDQALLVSDGGIIAMGPTDSVLVPPGAKVLDLPGYTVLPGLVGMHDHLYYSAADVLQRLPDGSAHQPGILLAEVAATAPRLYLAAGVTTARTTGSVEPYTDLKVKRRIEQGLLAGPELHLTAPYLEGPGTRFAQMHELTSPAEARRMVATWAAEGMTSFKAYMNLSRASLAAAVEEAHRRKLPMTGHLCSVTWPEAIAAGIDGLEHGPVFSDTELVPDKQPDVCPPFRSNREAWLRADIAGPAVQALIASLVSHHVAVTSTLPVFEAAVSGRPPLQRRVLEAMAPSSRESYLTARAVATASGLPEALLLKEMAFERAFFLAGGVLLAGCDPTGNGGVLPGFGDQREVELLVEAGLTPVEAIHVATENGARALGVADRLGTLAPGKQADLVVVKGDPSRTIADLENVELVFKRGVGFDSKALVESVRGQVGLR